ncbi:MULTISPECIES: GNAT family N-acetyltransferase [Prauserella salsuginis group]|uniref:GNAT family N-acetyltransferase n=1 Tax=Prauserella salsuginis TaxID=387889 RepID=A0ABW6GAX3_9PSEU|nr:MULTISPECIES: GNAT family protein [Prauserella salsuginis group]MCR3722382.1 Protein N-acetyltransferase, RimJ/RimL family [Prauserella flava]MCR3736824.1 Protein N-acetyltransferase, RimJ/RimL family [Prauserella salsuginis]
MTAPAFAHQPVLTGELVQLRPALPDDAPGLVALMREEALTWCPGRGTGVPALDDLAAAQQWYASCGRRGDRVDLAVVDRATGSFIGEAVLAELDRDNASCRCRIGLLGPYGDGHRDEATRLLLGYALDEAGLHRVETQVAACHVRAREAYEAAGFVREGTRREAVVTSGGRTDVHVLAVLAGDRTA